MSCLLLTLGALGFALTRTFEHPDTNAMTPDITTVIIFVFILCLLFVLPDIHAEVRRADGGQYETAAQYCRSLQHAP
jgi:hypothetical protein